MIDPLIHRLMRLLDKRFSGIARGVGTAKILGRVHSAQLNLSGLFLPCSFTIMEVRNISYVKERTSRYIDMIQGRDVDLLFGLDMLKAHQACIDLEKNVLRIQGREVSFLPEHELPEKSRIQELSEAPATDESPTQESSGNFPGSGLRLGSSNAANSSQSRGPSRPLSNNSRYPESSIRTIMDLGGVSREVAISTLDAAGGNVDVAASLLF